MDSLVDVTLGEVTENFNAQRIPVRSVDRRPGPHPYFGASGVVDHISDYLFEGDYLLISEDGENLRTRKTPIAFMASGKFWVNNHAHILQGNDQANTLYLCYALSNTDISGYLSGSTQPKLTQAAMKSIHLRIPSRFTQERIVEVVKALDDKIAVNERIAAAVESLTRLVLTESPSLERVPVSDLAELSKAQVKPHEVAQERVDHYSLPAFDSGRTAEYVSPDSIKSSKFIVQRPSVLVSKLNPEIPRVWVSTPRRDVPALASTEFLVLTPKEGVEPAELWGVIHQPELLSSLAARATGTSKSHQRVRPVEVMQSSVVDPRPLTAATRRARVLIARAARAREESRTLAELRDTLLPQLMSGKLRVREAEKVVEEAV